MAESLDERIRRVTQEEIEIVDYDPEWKTLFDVEKAHLVSCLPAELLGRIEHFGSTAVPGLAAKPIIDMLVEVSDLEETKARIVPVLESQGYEYFWRPTHGDNGPPFYAWFIKRDPDSGKRTHHIHMVERGFSEHWERLRFRDRLIQDSRVAASYAEMKRDLARRYPKDRVAYTQAKTDFIRSVMDQTGGT